MEEYKKDDRGRSKAKRLTQSDPREKVDSSSWTPPAPENADIKTGARPISKRLFKKGGKVIGAEAMKRADRKPRKSGGRALTADSLINRNVREANEEREGIKHVGAFKKGGRTGKLGGGTIGDNPVAMQNRSMGKATGMMNKGGRAKKADGGDVIADMIRKDEIARGQMGRGRQAPVPTPPRRPADQDRYMPDTNLTTQGAKKGGKIEHEDVAEDKALIKRMVKPEARTGKYTGGGIFSGNSKQKNPGEVGGRKAHAKGGRTGKTTINIVMGGHGQQPQSMPNAPVMPPRPPVGVPVPPPAMAGGAPPMGGMPPQMPPQMPGRATGGRTGKMVGGSLGNAAGYGQQPVMPQQPMMGQPGMMQQPGMMPRKAGGRTNYPIDAGAGGGKARLEKIEAYGLTPPKRK